MCGIAGIVATHALRPEDTGRVLRMRDVLAHRGPDGAGVFVDDRAALGHRRLSIVDLAGGAQPLANEDETIQVVFNGEIYNHADLRPQLEAAGHRYHTRSDTETIVHAYEQWGDDCVQRFRGMFAFAIWDAPRRRLLLARDRLGVKPLYWAWAGDRLLFASEIKAILESGLIEARANEAVLPEVLATRATAGEETLFRGIHKLLPGHVLTIVGRARAAAALLGRPVGAGAGVDRRGPRRRRGSVSRAARRVRPAAADERRAARRLPVRRHRLQRDRRTDGAPRRAAADVLGRASRTAPATSWPTRARSPRRSAPRTTR